MAICSTVKANLPLFLNRSKISNGNFCSSIRSRVVFCASSKYAIPEVKIIANSISNITSTTKKKMTAVQFNLEESQHKRSSSSKDPLDNILKYMKGLRIIPVAMAMLSLMGIIMMCGHQSALAFSGGAMGGYSFSSSSDSSSSSPDWGYSTSDYDDESTTSYHSQVPSFDDESVAVGVILVGHLLILLFILFYLWNRFLTRAKIIKLQVGLLVDGQSLQKDLNRIAKTTDSSTEDGWRQMLEEAINSLLRHEKYWISGSSSSVVKYNNEANEAKTYFNKLSIKERRKFSEETLVNLDDMKKESITSTKVNDPFGNTYIVVTIVMAANRMSYESHIPTIVHREDVKKALNELLLISNASQIQGLHILWAPQKENEVLSLKEFRENYPSLKAFQSVPAQVLGN